jgi:hypothetical protein
MIRVDRQHRLGIWCRRDRWPAAAPRWVGVRPTDQQAIEGRVGVRHEPEQVVKGPVLERQNDHMVHRWWHRAHLHKPGKRPHATSQQR